MTVLSIRGLNSLFIISLGTQFNTAIYYINKRKLKTMSQKLIERSNCSRSPYPRERSPVYLSPKAKPKQPQIHINPHLTSYNQFCVGNQAANRNLQQLPLQFSSNRKIKSRHPPPFNGITHFTSQPYAYPQINNNLNQQSINGRLHNQNKSFDSFDKSFNDSNKIKNYYENQIKNLLQKFKHSQADFQLKYINLQREKNYWKQSYNVIKQQFEFYKKERQTMKVEQNKQIQGKTYGKNIAQFEEIIRNLQHQILQNENYAKVTENELYNLNKQKAKLSYQLDQYKEESRKYNSHIFQLHQTLEIERRQLKQLKEKTRKQEEETCLIKSLDIKSSKLGDLTLSFDSISPSQQTQSTKRSNSNSKSRSSSSFSPSSLSVPSGSSRHKSKHRSSSHSNRHPPQENSQLAMNFDANKQIQKFRHICRKLEKTLIHQNTSIISQGLKNLNKKYQKMYEQQVQVERKLSEISINTDENKRIKEAVNFKFASVNTESKGKITSIKQIS